MSQTPVPPHAPRVPSQPPAPGGPPKIPPPPPPHKPPTLPTQPIDVVAESEVNTGSKIQAFGVAQMGAHQTKFKRPTVVSGHGAVRVRTFHGRLSDEGLAYMDDKINQWLDDHPEIEVKFVTSTVGQYEGKLKEPALIMNVWY